MTTEPRVWNTGRRPSSTSRVSRAKSGPAMVDGRMVHRPEHAIRNIGRSWNLQKVAAGACGHRSAPNAQYYRICKLPIADREIGEC